MTHLQVISSGPEGFEPATLGLRVRAPATDCWQLKPLAYAQDGAFMEPSFRHWWQVVASGRRLRKAVLRGSTPEARESGPPADRAALPSNRALQDAVYARPYSADVSHDFPAGYESEGFFTAKARPRVRCSARCVTARHQGYLHAAESFVVVENRAP
jgi:hypothetical protein